MEGIHTYCTGFQKTPKEKHWAHCNTTLLIFMRAFLVRGLGAEGKGWIQSSESRVQGSKEGARGGGGRG